MQPHITTYFYSPPGSIKKGIIKIKGEEAKHITRVLRKNKGDIIYVTDGAGNLYKTEIVGLESNQVKGEIREKVETFTEPSFNITLAVGSLRQKNMESIIDQATQLGVKRFVPLVVDYEVFKYRDDEHIQSLLVRWEKIAIRAMKQSFRTSFPEIHSPVSIDDFLRENEFDLMVFADAEGLPNLSQRKFTPDMDIFIAVGSEGGFSSREKTLLQDWDCIPLMLGTRRLRAETAAIIILSKILFWLKEI